VNWNEIVVAYFKALSQNMPGGTEENIHLNPDWRSSGLTRNLPNMKHEY
jgi:hypothetical protein